jgi:hypothetical protein
MAGPTSSSRQYNYKKPSSFNFVSFLMVLAALAGAYWAWKFGPVYYKRYKVEEVLREGSSEASGIRRMNEAAQLQISQQVLDRVTERLQSRGITPEDNGLTVYFDDHYRRLEADYVVVVRHPVGKPTTVKVHRSVSVAE